jgi:hypothetical protein
LLIWQQIVTILITGMWNIRFWEKVCFDKPDIILSLNFCAMHQPIYRRCAMVLWANRLQPHGISFLSFTMYLQALIFTIHKDMLDWRPGYQ